MKVWFSGEKELLADKDAKGCLILRVCHATVKSEGNICSLSCSLFSRLCSERTRGLSCRNLDRLSFIFGICAGVHQRPMHFFDVASFDSKLSPFDEGGQKWGQELRRYEFEILNVRLLNSLTFTGQERIKIRLPGRRLHMV